MLRGIAANRIIVGAYVDPSSGGICPMLAAHRNGGRTDLASFARAWDEYTDARRPRRATRREVAQLRSLLEDNLDFDSELDRTPIAVLAAQLRSEREQLTGCTDSPPPATAAPVSVPEPESAKIRVRRRPGRDLLSATERELSRP